MALKKLCSCGKIIDYNLKRCKECEEKYKIDKAEKNRIYDKNVRQLRDRKYTSFYHSKEWKSVVNTVKSMCKGLDIYSYYILHKIEYGNICHHLREIKKDGWNSRYDINRLILLTIGNHNVIHAMMEKDYEGTITMLKELIERWKKEFNN